jgi:hypothetical protein
MTRFILTGLTVAVAVVVLSGTGCQSSGVGDPCTPEQEYDPTFLGYDYHEVGVEPGSFQCLTRLCLVNHFEGRVSCPYGQTAAGTGNSPATAGCFTPGLGTAVGGAVLPQCTDRTANLAVYCSCRCKNIDGATGDGANYCTCPTGFECDPLVSSLGAGLDQGLTGYYCIKSGTAYASTASGASATVCETTCGGAMGTDCGNPDNTGGS